MNDNDSGTRQNRWVLASDSQELSGRGGLGADTTADDQVLMQQLDVYFSCPTHAARVQRALQSARGALRSFDPFAPADRTHPHRVFHDYKSAMTPIVQDFISRATVAVEALLASCRRLCDAPGCDACPGVAYILSCENLDIFMWLMRPADSPWSPSAAREQSNQERLAAQISAGQGGGSFLGMTYASTAGMADEEDNTMDLGDTTGTDMAVASPTSLERDLSRMLDPINDINSLLDPSEVVYPDLFSAALGLARDAQEKSLLAAEPFQRGYFPRFAGGNHEHGRGGGSSAASEDIDVDADDGDDGDDEGDDDDDDDDDDGDDESRMGSEEEFYEPDPSDPADGGLPCLALRPWGDWGTLSREA